MTIYGVIGVGSIATAIVNGLCDGVASAPEIVLSPRNADRATELAARFPSVRLAPDNQQVVDDSDVVIITVLPSQAVEVLTGLTLRADQAVVSAVAGLPVAELADLVAPATDIARSIPVPAVAARGSVTPVHPASGAAVDLYARLGGSMEIADELTYESVAAASATVAAHFHYLRTIADWLAAHDVPADAARRYVAGHLRRALRGADDTRRRLLRPGASPHHARWSQRAVHPRPRDRRHLSSRHSWTRCGARQNRRAARVRDLSSSHHRTAARGPSACSQLEQAC